MANFSYNPEFEKTHQGILAGYKEMEAANEERRKGITANYSALIEANRAYGAGERAKVNSEYKQQMDMLQHQALSRGMTGASSYVFGEQGINYGNYQGNMQSLNDKIISREQQLATDALNYNAQAQQAQAAITGAKLGFQGQAFGQQYGAAANYVSQADLQAQAAKTGYMNQSNLMAQQNQYALQTMRNQQAYDTFKMNEFGFY